MSVLKNNPHSFNENDYQVALLLKEHNIDYSCVWDGVGYEYYGRPEEKLTCGRVVPTQDKYRVSFRHKDKKLTTDFKSGMGHRRRFKFVPEEWRAAVVHDDKLKHEGLTVIPQRMIISNELDYGIDDLRLLWKIRRENYTLSIISIRAVFPTAASVLYCLLSDAALGNLTHQEFCNTLGIDPDSRKGLENYLACQQIGTDLLPVLGKAYQPIREVLQDY